MPAFVALDYRRLDVPAIVSFGGIATVVPEHHAAARTWLAREGYAIDTLDFSGGLAAAIPALGDLFRWEEQFGYVLTAGRRSLDALRDGFDFEIPGAAAVSSVIRALFGSADRARGNPAKVAQAILRIADEKQPPVRLLLGTDAVRAAAADRAAEDARWKDLSVSPDYDDFSADAPPPPART